MLRKKDRNEIIEILNNILQLQEETCIVIDKMHCNIDDFGLMQKYVQDLNHLNVGLSDAYLNVLYKCIDVYWTKYLPEITPTSRYINK